MCLPIFCMMFPLIWMLVLNIYYFNKFTLKFLLYLDVALKRHLFLSFLLCQNIILSHTIYGILKPKFIFNIICTLSSISMIYITQLQ